MAKVMNEIEEILKNVPTLKDKERISYYGHPCYSPIYHEKRFKELKNKYGIIYGKNSTSEYMSSSII